MTGEVVNLRLARKKKKRAEAEAAAEANRISHGLSKAEKKRLKAHADAAARHLDGHRKDGKGKDGGEPA